MPGEEKTLKHHESLRNILPEYQAPTALVDCRCEKKTSFKLNSSLWRHLARLSSGALR